MMKIRNAQKSEFLAHRKYQISECFQHEGNYLISSMQEMQSISAQAKNLEDFLA